MPTSIAERLAELGQLLPEPSSPVATYVSTARSGRLLFVSGEISLTDGEPGPLGRVGAELTEDDGRKAAEAAALGVLAQVAAATDGTVTAVTRVLRLGVFVAASAEFTRHPQVANGASNLIMAVFGDAGRHTRTAVGVASLPRGVAVEVDAVVELADGH